MECDVSQRAVVFLDLGRFTWCLKWKTPSFLNSGSPSSPFIKKSCLSRRTSVPLAHKLLAHRIGFVTSATCNSYRFVNAPTCSKNSRVPCPWSGLPSARRRRTRSSVDLITVVPNHMGQTLTDASHITHHPSSVVHSATTLTHGDVVDRVLNCEHELTTLIGCLFLDLVDHTLSLFLQDAE